MKQKAKSPGQKQPESCGVWLDTSALKKRKIQSFMAKPVLRTLNQLSHCPLPTKALLQCTKQTTISTFFSTQGEEKKTNSNRSLAVALKRASTVNNHQLFRGGKPMLPANMLQEGGGWTQQGFHISPSNSTIPEVQATTCILLTGRRDSAAGREDPQLLNFIEQLEEEKRDPDRRTLLDLTLREKNNVQESKKHTTLLPQTSQSPAVTNKDTKIRRRHRWPPSCDSSFMQPCDSENINPQLEQSTRNKSVARLCLEINEAICSSDKGIEKVGLVGLPMFTQDTEDHKGNSPFFLQERRKTSLRKKLRDESNSVMSPSYHDCLGVGCSTEKGTYLSPGGSVSAVTDSSEKSCYDLLFTEDSEGNRVIKH